MRRLAFVCAAGGLALLLAACSSSSSSSSGTSTSAEPTPTPTPSSVIWAGRVCESFDRVTASVGALGRNLSYDITSDRSALEQIQRQVTIQILALGDAANQMKAALADVPVDLVAANDLVATLMKGVDDTTAAVSSTQQHLEAAGSSDSIVTTVAEIGQALIAAKAAFDAGTAVVSAISETTSAATGDLRTAFDAAPQCSSGSGSPTASVDGSSS